MPGCFYFHFSKNKTILTKKLPEIILITVNTKNLSLKLHILIKTEKNQVQYSSKTREKSCICPKDKSDYAGPLQSHPKIMSC